MFKYRVLTFTIILSMLLFYATPISSVDVKAEEVTYTQRQLQDVGAWFIGERLLEGAFSDFDFSNLPTDLTPEDFLADLGKVFAEGDPLPLMNDMSQAIDDIWNGLVEEYSKLSSEQAWDMVKDFFYTLWYDVPQSPSLPPLVNVFGIAGDLLEAADIDYLLQYANTDIPSVVPDQDYISFINTINSDNWSSGYDFFWKYYQFRNTPLVSFEPSSVSWLNYYTYQSSNIVSTQYSTTNMNISPIVNLDIRYNNNTYNLILSNYVGFNNLNSNTDQVYYFQANQGTLYSTWAWRSNMQSQLWSNGSIYSNSSLNQVFNFMQRNFRNVNIYVEGEPWSLVYIEPQNPIASRDLTYPNYEPAKYNYPEGTSVDWNRLYTIIYNAVRDGIVIDFGDLEDCFVDVNGQTAVAVLGLVRNDYDKLVDEQFNMVPYPRFNNNLYITNLAEEMTEPAQNGVTIIENAYNIFPLPLQKALLFAGALLLFGLLIRRFLE